MKFNDLYNRVFIKEQDETEEPITTDVSEVPMPEDIEVEPAPLPEPASEDQTAADSGASIDFDEFIMQATELSDKLVSSSGNDLLSKISQMDKPGTPFENMYGSLKSNVVRASEALSDLASQLLVYKNAPKR